MADDECSIMAVITQAEHDLAVWMVGYLKGLSTTQRYPLESYDRDMLAKASASLALLVCMDDDEAED